MAIIKSTEDRVKTLETTVNNSTKSLAPYRLVSSGVFTVPTAGTQLQLTATSTPCRKIVFQCLTGNSGDMYVGLSDVSATTANLTVKKFSALESESLPIVEFEIENANRVYIDSANNNDKVSYFIYE